jgi:aerobic-type carbon monoxide dehydrogenase small subunit (CoxS/CutS family)
VDEDGKLTVTLQVNGRTHRVRARLHHTLLQALRDELKLFGAREGCGVGMCGACTVQVDGKLISSCLLLAVLAEARRF